MGLAIYAMNNVKRISDIPEDHDYDDNLHALYPNTYFNVHGDITTGIYDGDNYNRYRISSYSGYNAWRDSLAKLAGYNSFDHACQIEQGSFVELLNFSDCEGVICADVSKKLYQDFIQFHSTAISTFDEYDLSIYEDFMKAFSIAKENGVVSFC